MREELLNWQLIKIVDENVRLYQFQNIDSENSVDGQIYVYNS